MGSAVKQQQSLQSKDKSAVRRWTSRWKFGECTKSSLYNRTRNHSHPTRVQQNCAKHISTLQKQTYGSVDVVDLTLNVSGIEVVWIVGWQEAGLMILVQDASVEKKLKMLEGFNVSCFAWLNYYVNGLFFQKKSEDYTHQLLKAWWEITKMSCRICLYKKLPNLLQLKCNTIRHAAEAEEKKLKDLKQGTLHFSNIGELWWLLWAAEPVGNPINYKSYDGPKHLGIVTIICLEYCD